jgi:hypothetical protein
MRAVTNRHRHHHRVPQDPRDAAQLRNGPLVRVCHLRHHSRYRREQGCAPELL